MVKYYYVGDRYVKKSDKTYKYAVISVTVRCLRCTKSLKNAQKFLEEEIKKQRSRVEYINSLPKGTLEKSALWRLRLSDASRKIDGLQIVEVQEGDPYEPINRAIEKIEEVRKDDKSEVQGSGKESEE